MDHGTICWVQARPQYRRFCSGSLEANLQLVQNLTAAVENNPDVVSEISQVLDTGTASRLEQILAKQADVEPSQPTTYQLGKVALAASLPYFGFGVLDNAVMILLGEAIDATLCVKFGFSTMAAAALGNTFSDAIGVYSGGAVEDLAQRYGFEAPRLSRAQESMPVTRFYQRLGQLLGIMIGCIVGMFPLLFNLEHSDIHKREKDLNEMFDTVVNEIPQLLHCEAAMLLLIDHATQEIVPRSTTNSKLAKYREPVGRGTSGKVAQTGEYLNIDDLPSSAFYEPGRHDDYFGTGIKVRNVLAFPIFGIDPADKQYKVLGVLQVINKRGFDQGFNHQDEDACAVLCSHISTSLATTYGLEQGFRDTLKNCARSLNMRGARPNTAQEQRAQIAYEEIMGYCTEMLDASVTQLLVADPSFQTDDLILKASDKVLAFREKSSEFPVTDRCRLTGTTICVNDFVDSPYYNPVVHSDYKGSGINVRAVLATPCFSSAGEVLAVLACLKGDDRSATFTPSDVHFFASVASLLAIHLQGSGASLDRILTMTKNQHVRAAADMMQADCNKEVRTIMATVINLVHKAGGQVEQADIGHQIAESLEQEGRQRTSHIGFDNR